MRHLHLKLLSSVFLALLAFPLASNADVIVPKDTVTGTVIGKKKEPIPGAKVEIVGQPYYVLTDLDGRFNIKCEQGARKVRVSYPKARTVNKKISPDMTVQIGRSWRQVPEQYQWFAGANIGIALTSTDFRFGRYPLNDDFIAPNISIMTGRVKAVGWYIKGFFVPSSTGINQGVESTTSAGAILGGMVRLGCPLHLYLGGGFAHTDFRLADEWLYNYNWLWQIDMGLLFRIKDNYGINLSTNVGTNKSVDVLHGSTWNIGFCYFFNK